MATTEPVGGPRSRSTNDPRLSRAEIVELLRTAPAHIAAATEGLGDAALATSPGPER